MPFDYEKPKNIGKALLATIVILATITVIPSIVEEAIFPSNIGVEDKTVNLGAGESEVVNFTNRGTDSSYIWEWNIQRFSGEEVNFRMIDPNGNVHNNLTTSATCSSDQGAYSTTQKGTYQFIWENKDEKSSVTLHIKELTEWRTPGSTYADMIFFAAFICITVLGIWYIIKRKKEERTEDEKKETRKYIIIGIILFSLFTLWMILPPILFPLDDEPNELAARVDIWLEALFLAVTFWIMYMMIKDRGHVVKGRLIFPLAKKKNTSLHFI